MPTTLSSTHVLAENSAMISSLLTYQMLPQFLNEQIIDQAIAPIECTAAETANAYHQFRVENHLMDELVYQAWLKHHHLTEAQFKDIATRPIRIEKFKRMQWGHKVSGYFLEHKHRLDQVVYSVLRTSSLEVALELYYRILEGEQSFSELACQYSEGPEAMTGGLTGPIELADVPAMVAELLRISQPGQLWEPIPIAEWSVILRLERYIPAQLDEAMYQRLLDEFFEAWLQGQQASHEICLEASSTDTESREITIPNPIKLGENCSLEAAEIVSISM